jgi:hypothetical protein
MPRNDVKTDNEVLSKPCSKCKVILPLSEFNNNASTHSAIKKTSWCKKCLKKDHDDKMKNPVYAEKMRKKAREYYQVYAEQQNKRRKEYYETHEKNLELKKLYKHLRLYSMLNNIPIRKLKQLIEGRFVNNMSWKNYGLRWLIRLNEVNDILVIPIKNKTSQ